MNNDDMEYLYGATTTSTEEETTEEEVIEETTTSTEKETTEEEVIEETTTSTEEETTEEEIIEETTIIDNSYLINLVEEQNTMIANCYDMLTYIFIVLMFILFRTYVLHIFDAIRSMGKE